MASGPLGAGAGAGVQVDHGAQKWRAEFVARVKPLFVDNIEALAPYYARFFPLSKEVAAAEAE